MPRKPRDLCLNCNNPVSRKPAIYCSLKCQQTYQYKLFVDKWLKREIEGGRDDGITFSRHIKRWLIETHGVKCSICGITEWMSTAVPLVIDHISGNAQDNHPNNLRLVCGNCNMQLPTFAGGNKGSGRIQRKNRDRKEFGYKAGLPQLVEDLTRNQVAVGSTPTSSSKTYKKRTVSSGSAREFTVNQMLINARNKA